MSPVPAPEPQHGLDLGPRGTARTSGDSALRAEKAQLVHWRRLLRARLDLLVAGLAPPERLGTLASDLPPGATDDLPDADHLRSAVTVPSVEDTVDLMNRIRSMDRALRHYGEHLDAALEAAARDLVHELADPRLPAAPSAG